MKRAGTIDAGLIQRYLNNEEKLSSEAESAFRSMIKFIDAYADLRQGFVIRDSIELLSGFDLTEEEFLAGCIGLPELVKRADSRRINRPLSNLRFDTEGLKQ